MKEPVRAIAEMTRGNIIQVILPGTAGNTKHTDEIIKAPDLELIAEAEHVAEERAADFRPVNCFITRQDVEFHQSRFDQRGIDDKYEKKHVK